MKIINNQTYESPLRETSAWNVSKNVDPAEKKNGSTPINEVLQALLQTISGSGVTSAVTKSGAGNITGALGGTTPFQNMVAPHAATVDNTPKAYLTVLFFDERFKFIEEGSSYLRVNSADNSNASLTLANIKAPKNGYVYVYVSNESDEPVYFDNLQVAHNRGRIVEENHYYAFGLKIAGISSRKLAESYEGNVENKYLYNDKELFEEGDLNWYDYGFRNYDAQIARFVQIDPLTDEYALVSGYQYALNDPISNVDVFGLFADNVLQQVMCQGDKLVRTSALLAAGKATSVLANTIAQGEKGKVAMQQVNTVSYKRLDGYSRKSTLSLIGQDNSKKQTGEKQSVYKSAVPIAISAAAADGPLPIGDVVGGVILAGATIYDATQRTFITYTITDFFGKVYVGRTSGYGDPYSIMMNRFSNHHMKKFGYKNPELDRAVQGYDGYPAIRGREQQLIDFLGGVGSSKVGNRIRGVSRFNPAGRLFHTLSNLYFGPLANYTGF